MNAYISGDIQVQVEKHKACLRCFERFPAYDVHFTCFVRQGWAYFTLLGSLCKSLCSQQNPLKLENFHRTIKLALW